MNYATNISDVPVKKWKKPKEGEPKPIATLLDGQDLITTGEKGAISGSRNLTILVQNYRPGGFHEPHSHSDVEQVFFVLEGEGQFMLNDEWFDVKTGDVIYAPTNTSHAARNNSEDTLVIIFISVGLGNSE